MTAEPRRTLFKHSHEQERYMCNFTCCKLYIAGTCATLHCANLKCKHQVNKRAIIEHGLSLLLEKDIPVVHMVGAWEEMSMSNCVSLLCSFSEECQGSTH